jgi:hypothetical protein
MILLLGVLTSQGSMVQLGIAKMHSWQGGSSCGTSCKIALRERLSSRFLITFTQILSASVHRMRSPVSEGLSKTVGGLTILYLGLKSGFGYYI